jgi:hypothetical protein
MIREKEKFYLPLEWLIRERSLRDVPHKIKAKQIGQVRNQIKQER